MNCNVGKVDRNIRIGFGLGALALGAFGGFRSNAVRAAALTFGAAGLITGATRFCPMSKLLGINTCKPEERAEMEAHFAEEELAGTGI